MIVSVTLYCPGCGGEVGLFTGILATRRGAGRYPDVKHAHFVACRACALAAEIDPQTGRLADGRQLADLERSPSFTFTKQLGRTES